MASLPQEVVQPNEPGIIAEILAGVLHDQEASYVAGSVARRDVHRKGLGSPHGTFRVLNNIPLAQRVGLFATPATYDAVLRFSNGAPSLAPDIVPNVRGVGLSVYGVPGPKLLPGDENATRVDFLLANHPTTFHTHVDDYAEVRELMQNGKTGVVLKKYPHEGRALLRAVLKFVKNPLRLTYWSQTPYALGDGPAVKYVLVPQKPGILRRLINFFSIPNIFDGDYLRHAEEKTLRKQSVKFTLFVQIQQEGDSIEDSSVDWNGPVVAVAEVVLPRIGADATLLESGGEGDSYNPWRTLAAHRPLGWVNRVRGPVYNADFLWRRAKNAAASQSK